MVCTLYLLLLLGCCFPDRSFMEVLEDFCLLFPCFQGDKNFLEGLFHAGDQCPGKSDPCLLVSYFCDEEGLHGLFYLISNSITLVSVFPLHSVQEYRIK